MEERSVSYDVALEYAEARHERTVKRFIFAVILMIIIIFANNAIWLYAWMQYEYVGEEVTVEGADGIASYVGRNGVITNGTSDSTP